MIVRCGRFAFDIGGLYKGYFELHNLLYKYCGGIYAAIVLPFLPVIESLCKSLVLPRVLLSFVLGGVFGWRSGVEGDYVKPIRRPPISNGSRGPPFPVGQKCRCA